MPIEYVPCTPAGTALIELAAPTRKKAIRKLLVRAAHMPYGTWENFERRGYTIAEMELKTEARRKRP